MVFHKPADDPAIGWEKRSRAHPGLGVRLIFGLLGIPDGRTLSSHFSGDIVPHALSGASRIPRKRHEEAFMTLRDLVSVAVDSVVRMDGTRQQRGNGHGKTCPRDGSARTSRPNSSSKRGMRSAGSRQASQRLPIARMSSRRVHPRRCESRTLRVIHRS